MLWVGAETGRQRIFDCDYCCKSGLVDSRNCFLYEEEEQLVEISQEISDEDGNLVYSKGQVLSLTPDDICSDVIATLSEICKNASPLEILRRFLNKVCPKSFITEEIDHYIMLELFTKDYHIPPFTGVGLYDYPQRLVNIFSIIAGTRERVRFKELKEMQGKIGKGTK